MSRAMQQPDDRQMRLYLLGRLSQAERDELQQQFFANDSSYERLLEAENDLIDAYVRGTLNAKDAGDVEEGLLASPEKLDSARFAQALWRAEERRRERQSSWHHGTTRHWLIASGLAFVAIAAAGWFGIQNSRLRRDLAALQRTPTTSVAPLDQLRQPRSAPAIATITLVPELRGSTSNAVRIDRSAELVKVELVDARGFDSFTVQVERRGERIWTANGLKPSAAGAATVWLPAQILRAGDYEFLLYGETPGPQRLAGSYSAHVESR